MTIPEREKYFTIMLFSFDEAKRFFQDRHKSLEKKRERGREGGREEEGQYT